MNVIDLNECRPGFLMFGRLEVHCFGVILNINTNAANAEFAINANPICGINTAEWLPTVAGQVQLKLIELDLIALNEQSNYELVGDHYVSWLTPPKQDAFFYDGLKGFVDHHENNIIRVYYGDLRMVPRVCPAELREYLATLGYK